MDDLRSVLHLTADGIADYRERAAERRVFPGPEWEVVRTALDAPTPEDGLPVRDVLRELVEGATPGLVTSVGPRYFGFVTGGSVDAALCADLLAVGWDQLAFNPVSSPAAAAFEAVAGRWLKDLLRLPATASVGFVTGGQAANTVCLAAARWKVLRDAGWDVGADGLFGAPRVRVVVGEERHATIDRSLRLLGIGQRAVEEVAADAHGALDAAALAAALRAGEGPAIVCAQAGNVNTGAFDPFDDICAIAAEHGAWVHVDGAFGLWAAASPRTSHLVAGAERADSWACDGHKWLNVPYDSGFAICADPEAHAASMQYTASYLTGQDLPREPVAADLTPESSRRARGFAVWAAVRSMGRSGVAGLVERCCAMARRFADGLGALDGFEIVNRVELNQVLVRVAGVDADDVAAAVQDDGSCWLGATTWRGERLLRISVSSWATTEADVDASVAAIARAAKAVASG